MQVHTSLAGVPRDAHVRLLRLGEDVDAVAALSAMAPAGGGALRRRVRSVKVDGGRNASALAAACRWLDAAGYTLYRGGMPLARAAECGGGITGSSGVDAGDIVAHYVA